MVKAVYGTRATERSKASFESHSRTFQTAEDIIPVAELKANMSEIVRGLDARSRPLVVTLNGKPAAVVMSPREYVSLAYRTRLVEAINEGLADTAAGRTHDAEEVFAELLGETRRKKPRRAR
jgi:prevent-host-death family protein